MGLWVEAVLELLAKQGSLHGFDRSTSMLEIGSGSWLSGDHLHGKDLKRYQNGIPKAEEAYGKEIIKTLRSHIWSNKANIPKRVMSCKACQGDEMQERKLSIPAKTDLKHSVVRSRRTKTPSLEQAQFVGYYKNWGSSAALGIPCGVIQISDYKIEGVNTTPVSDIPWFYGRFIETTLPCTKHTQKTKTGDVEKDNAPKPPLRVWVPTPENFINDSKLRKLNIDQIILAFETYDVLHRLDGMNSKAAQEICTRI